MDWDLFIQLCILIVLIATCIGAIATEVIKIRKKP